MKCFTFIKKYVVYGWSFVGRKTIWQTGSMVQLEIEEECVLPAK